MSFIIEVLAALPTNAMVHDEQLYSGKNFNFVKFPTSESLVIQSNSLFQNDKLSKVTLNLISTDICCLLPKPAAWW